MKHLYSNKTPFGLLSQEEQTHLVQSKETVEVYSGHQWKVKPCLVWNPDLTYRLRPPQLKFPWELIDRRWNWVTKSADLEVMLWAERPTIEWLHDEQTAWWTHPGQIKFEDVSDIFLLTDWKGPTELLIQGRPGAK